MKKSKRYAFTLVELLVVIGIIALLISILLPALNKAKAAANTTACLANLRSMGQAMTMYVATNKGYIPGSGNTSGRHIWIVGGAGTPVLSSDPTLGTYTIRKVPLVNECNDYIGPLAQMMQIKNPILDANEGTERFKVYTALKQFQCPSFVGVYAAPSASGTTTDSAGVAIGPRQVLSYNTALAFLEVPYKVYNKSQFAGSISCSNGTGYFVLPDGYVPKITKVGAPSGKVYAAAAGARVTSPSAAPKYQPSALLSASPQTTDQTTTMFADIGPFFASTRSYNRDGINPSSTSKAADARLLAMRHGQNAPFSKGGLLRFNLVFYDGHAETMDDMTGANPALWLPRGTTWTNAAMTATDATGTGCKWCFDDVYAKYMNGSDYTAP